MLYQKLKNLLRYNQLSKTFSVYTFGKVVSVIISIFLLPLFTRKLPKAEFGIIGLLWLIKPILSRMMNLGMDLGIAVKFFKTNHKELSNILYNGIFTITTIGFIIWFIGHINIKFLQSVIDKSLTKKVYLFLVLACLFFTYIKLMRSFLRNAGKAKANVIMTILPSIFTTLITFALFFTVEASYVLYIAGMAISYGFFGIIALIYLLRNYPVKYYKFSGKILKNLLKIGLPVLPGTLGGLILASGDRYVIKYILGLEAVAVYTFGYKISQYLTRGLLEPFQKAFAPIVYKKSAQNLQEGRKYSVKIINIILTLLAIIIAAITIPMRDIMHLISGGKYAFSYYIYAWVLIGIFIFTASQLESNLLIFMEKTKITGLTTLLVGLVNIVLNIFLIPMYGLMAAVFTTIFSYLLMLIIRNYYLVRYLNIKSLKPILSRIVMFAVYISLVVILESIFNNLFILYMWKILLFFLYLLVMYKMFNDIKDFLAYGKKI